MLIVYAVVTGIIIGLIMGGNLKYLAQNNFQWKTLAVIAFLIQIIIFSDIPFWKPSGGIIVFLHLISYITLLVFIFINIKAIGLIIIGAGIFLNALVIFINGGYMPTLAKNLLNTSMNRYAETISQGNAVHNSAEITRTTLLPWLGDIFYLPSWIPLSNVFSIGDVIIAVGICIYFVFNMKLRKIHYEKV